MPKLWNETIEEHRRAVREATLDTAAELVARDGFGSLSMSQIAEETGIARATLYKYFPDIEAILVAWHERQIARHLDYLGDLAATAADPLERLTRVLEEYAFIQNEHGRTELGALLHRGEHFGRAEKQLEQFVQRIVENAASAGHVRSDVSPAELARFCVHALSAASALGSKAAVRRLVSMTLDALRAPSAAAANSSNESIPSTCRRDQGS